MESERFDSTYVVRDFLFDDSGCTSVFLFFAWKTNAFAAEFALMDEINSVTEGISVDGEANSW